VVLAEVNRVYGLGEVIETRDVLGTSDSILEKKTVPLTIAKGDVPDVSGDRGSVPSDVLDGLTSDTDANLKEGLVTVPEITDCLQSLRSLLRDIIRTPKNRIADERRDALHREVHRRVVEINALLHGSLPD